jgi:1-aminocyclopropane-1-carboxylate deaminase/D-cysteine desulfhydrase-like pyridoxal-dependent ACC family enzyme
MEAVAAQERAADRVPYIIPVGGSNRVGAAAYALAFQELWDQTRERGPDFNRVVFATSSAGTHAGLIAGAAACGYQGQLLGISIDAARDELAPLVAALADEVAAHLDIPRPLPAHLLTVDDGYLGAGYGIVGEPEREAIHLLARTEGLLLDPVYTGRAMAGLLDHIRRGRIGPHETVLFWHTGGTAALFAYTEALLP